MQGEDAGSIKSQQGPIKRVQCLIWQLLLLKTSKDESLPSMGFLDHLEELRRRIIWSIVYIVGGFCVCYWFHEEIYNLMQRPIFRR